MRTATKMNIKAWAVVRKRDGIIGPYDGALAIFDREDDAKDSMYFCNPKKYKVQPVTIIAGHGEVGTVND